MSALNPGTHLGHYEIVEAVGSGGMGEVYRARDTKLGRDVAIKVLREDFSRDKELGLEESGGQQFLVMESLFLMVENSDDFHIVVVQNWFQELGRLVPTDE